MKALPASPRLGRLASSQNPDSDVSKINAAAGSHYVQVDPAVYEMIPLPRAFQNGAAASGILPFGIITNLWQIGTEHQHVPEAGELAEAMQRVNYKDILLRPEDHSVMLAKAGMSIDLGASPKAMPSMRSARFTKPIILKAD